MGHPLLVVKEPLFWTFRWWKIRSFLSQKIGGNIFTGYWKVLALNCSGMRNTVFFETKSWWKDHIYWLLKSSCFEIFGDGKYSLFWCKKLMETWCLLITEKFLLSANDKFFFWTFRWWELWNFLAKHLMQRCLLGLFELSIIFQDLGNTVFCAVGDVFPTNLKLIISKLWGIVHPHKLLTPKYIKCDDHLFLS